ncbi:hypothetical protein ACFQV2_37910 [Actinokineospora soli]|uniref:Lipoprotein n=1 Tax=Actinokineospora soli TaxID=1048753 RepID=A0ABW2TWX9_9PSEU
MRFAAVAAGVLVLAAGCAESKPAAVSGGFKDTVTGLLRQVAPDASPTFDAMTCGALTDPDPDSHVAMWADATLSGVAADELRRAGVQAGWQPVRADGFDVVLVSPDDVRLALRGGTVRAELANCSIAGKHQELDFHPVVPELTTEQEDVLSVGLRTTAEAVTAIHEVIGQPVDEAVFPRSGRVADATGLPVSTCKAGSGERGANWAATTKRDLPAGTDPARVKQEITGAFGDGWTVDPRPKQPGFLKAQNGSLTISVTLSATSFELSAADLDCVGVTGS